MEGKTQVTNKRYDFTLGKEWYVIQKAAEIPRDKNEIPKRKGRGKKTKKQKTKYTYFGDRIKFKNKEYKVKP